MVGSYLREGREDFHPDLCPVSNSVRVNPESFLSNVWNNNLDSFNLHDGEILARNYSAKSTCEDCLDKLVMKIHSLVDLCGEDTLIDGGKCRIFDDGIRVRIISKSLQEEVTAYEVFTGMELRDGDFNCLDEGKSLVQIYNSGEWEKAIDRLYEDNVLPLFD